MAASKHSSNESSLMLGALAYPDVYRESSHHGTRSESALLSFPAIWCLRSPRIAQTSWFVMLIRVATNWCQLSTAVLY